MQLGEYTNQYNDKNIFVYNYSEIEEVHFYYKGLSFYSKNNSLKKAIKQNPFVYDFLDKTMRQNFNLYFIYENNEWKLISVMANNNFFYHNHVKAIASQLKFKMPMIIYQGVASNYDFNKKVLIEPEFTLDNKKFLIKYFSPKNSKKESEIEYLTIAQKILNLYPNIKNKSLKILKEKHIFPNEKNKKRVFEILMPYFEDLIKFTVENYAKFYNINYKKLLKSTKRIYADFIRKELFGE